MTDLTPAQIATATGCPLAHCEANWPILLDAMQALSIASLPSQIGMAATVAVETGDFTPKIENLNYGATGLRETWPTRFTTDEHALTYARHPEKIANYVYAGRNGNGDEASGDGWRYRGRGDIQLTGRGNYRTCGFAIGHDLLAFPDDAVRPLVAARIAAWFWADRGIAPSCDLHDWKAVRRKVNGGLTAYADFIRYVERMA